MRPEHLQSASQAIKFGQLPPLFVAEVVSPGGESSDNYICATMCGSHGSMRNGKFLSTGLLTLIGIKLWFAR